MALRVPTKPANPLFYSGVIRSSILHDGRVGGLSTSWTSVYAQEAHQVTDYQQKLPEPKQSYSSARASERITTTFHLPRLCCGSTRSRVGGVVQIAGRGLTLNALTIGDGGAYHATTETRLAMTEQLVLVMRVRVLEVPVGLNMGAHCSEHAQSVEFHPQR